MFWNDKFPLSVPRSTTPILQFLLKTTWIKLQPFFSYQFNDFALPFSPLRFTKTVNYNIISTAVMKTLPAGCVTFAAPVIEENRIFTFFNTTKRFTTERLQLSLLEKNCLYGMRMYILSTWEFHWILQTLAVAYCSRITTQVSKKVKWGYIALISSMVTMINNLLITSFFLWLRVVQCPFILQISLNLRFSFMIALNFFANGDCFLLRIFRVTKSSHHRKEFLRLDNHLKNWKNSCWFGFISFPCHKRYTFSPLSSTDCPVHTGSFFGHDSTKQNTRRPNNEESRFLNNTKTDHGFSSVVFSPSTRHSQTRVPNLFPSRSDEYRVQMQGRGLEKAISQRDHYRPPVRRAIVIEKLEDAPDPFSVLIKDKWKENCIFSEQK